jgi:hypothetical protein
MGSPGVEPARPGRGSGTTSDTVGIACRGPVLPVE